MADKHKNQKNCLVVFNTKPQAEKKPKKVEGLHIKTVNIK
jgi:hypothetical protein